MVYTLSGPGPLWGLPSLSLTNHELAKMGSLSAFDKSIEMFNLIPGKRIVTIDFISGGEPIPFMTFRGLKTRGFFIYGVVDSYMESEIQWIDALIIERARGPWPMVNAMAYCYVREDGQALEEPKFIPEVAGVPKFLRVPEVDQDVLMFLRKSPYLWNVQVETKRISIQAPKGDTVEEVGR